MNLLFRGIAGLALAYTLAVCLAWSLTGNLDRDENQFLASAFLIAESGLHPYRDFAYFHMPNLSYLYAPLFFSDNPLLLARILTALCAFGICLTVFWHGCHTLRNRDRLVQLAVPVCLVLLLVHSHMFKHAVSHVWNHAPSVLFCLFAFILLLRWRERPRSTLLIGCSGFTLGMAIGIRLSIAPMVIPFLFLILIHPEKETRSKCLLTFAVAGLGANLPGLYFLVFDFSEFIFGNLVYPGFNTEYYREIGFSRAMDLPGKTTYFWNWIMGRPSHQLIAFAGGACVLMSLVSAIFRRSLLKADILATALAFPFLIAGCLAPTPSQKQYFFILFPFFILLVLNFVSTVDRKYLSGITAVFMTCILFLSFLTYSPFSFRDKLAKALKNRDYLTVNVLARESREIRRRIADQGDDTAVLTLSPAFVINDGTAIHPEFATGPFAFTYSHLIPKQQAHRQRIPRKGELDQFFQSGHTAAVLTGHEKPEIEQEIIDTAMKYNYSRVDMPSGNVLWLPSK